MGNKKWYNYFVVTEGQGQGGASEAPEAPEALDPSSLPKPVAAPRRVVDVVPDAGTETTFTAPVTSPTALDEIYRSARIATAAHGYSVLKVAEMLQSEHIRALPAEVKRNAIMVALDAAGVKVKEIIEDAVQRDRALDTYERVLQKGLEDLRAKKELENQRLEKEINQRLAELRTQIEANNKEVSREQDGLLSWRARKHQEEERIAEAVSYFVSENPITTAPKGKGGADVR